MQLLRMWRRVPLTAGCRGIMASVIRKPANLKCSSTLQSHYILGSMLPTSSVAIALFNTSRTSPSKQNVRLQTGFVVRNYSDENKMTALVAFKDLKHLKSSPLPALVMGVSGLLPFIIVPTSMILSGVFYPGLAYSQVAYGASILSFLGGIRWGFTITKDSHTRPDWTNLGFSVCPALFAWAGLLLPTTDLSILALTAGLAWVVYFDAAMWGYPPWFKALRFVLSIIAIVSLWTTLVCKYILCDAKAKKLKDAKKKEMEKAVAEMKEAQMVKMQIEKEDAVVLRTDPLNISDDDATKIPVHDNTAVLAIDDKQSPKL